MFCVLHRWNLYGWQIRLFGATFAYLGFALLPDMYPVELVHREVTFCWPDAIFHGGDDKMLKGNMKSGTSYVACYEQRS